VFDRHGTDRLTYWKQFRDYVEVSSDPLKDVAEFWGNAPFVSAYLNPQNPTEWPDPWHLVLDSRLDELAIALGMLYTIKLTRRFMDSKCEIHTSMLPKEKHPRYFLIVDDVYVLNFEYKNVVDVTAIPEIKTSLIWSKQ
jgi:hypothetical protein